MIQDVITLENGISYTKEQVRIMFENQIKTISQQVIPADRRKLKRWLVEGNEH